MYTQSVTSLLRMFRDDLPPGSLPIIEDGWSTLPEKHNSLVRYFLRAGAWTHLLLLDSDMIFPPGMVLRLLGYAKAVTGVLYARRLPPFALIGGTCSPPDGPGTGAVTMGRRVWPDVYPLRPGQGLQRADMLGGGVLLVHRRVFETTAPPWFEMPPTTITSGGHLTDDYYFCEKVRAAGFELWCDTDLEVGHMIVEPITPRSAEHWRAAFGVAEPLAP
jgi:hypothetical protein